MDEEQKLSDSRREAGTLPGSQRRATRRASTGDHETPIGALGTVERLLASPNPATTLRLTDLVFRELTGIETKELRELFIGRGEFPERVGARRLREQVAELLGCRLTEASELLGASISRFRRNDRLSQDLLDRAYAVVDVYVRVASVLGPRGAAAWLGQPNPVFDGAAPRQLMKTFYGCRLVHDLVDALLAGSYV